MESWKPIPGWETFYEVSDAGRVRSLTRTIWVPNPKGVVAPRTFQGRVLTPALCANRYSGVQLSRPGGRPKHYLVQHLVAAAFRPRPTGATTLRHLNDQPRDNRVENLAWGSSRDNTHDAIRNGRKFGGVVGPHIAPEAVARVRALRAAGVSERACAAQLGISRGQVQRCRK